MAGDSRARRKTFGPLFYSTSIVAVVLLSIKSFMTISDSLEAWIRDRREAQSIQQLLNEAKNVSPEVRARAFRSVVESEQVVRLLDEHPSYLRVLIPVLLAGSSDQDEEVRIEAIRGLGVVVRASFQSGPDSRPSTPEESKACLQALRRLLNDPSPIVRTAASDEIAAFAWARGGLGFEGMGAIVDDLAAALSDPDRAVRLATARTLMAFEGDRNEAAVETLLALLTDPEPDAARLTVVTILKAHHQDERALTILTNLLGSRNPFVLTELLVCIESLGSHAEAALPAIEALPNDEDPLVRAAAGQTFLAVEGVGVEDPNPSPRRIAILVKAVADQEFPLDWRMTAAGIVLGSNPAALSHAAGDLAKQLASEKPDVRHSAAELLVMLVDQVRAETQGPDPER